LGCALKLLLLLDELLLLLKLSLLLKLLLELEELLLLDELLLDIQQSADVVLFVVMLAVHHSVVQLPLVKYLTLKTALWNSDVATGTEKTVLRVPVLMNSNLSTSLYSPPPMG
jgi:hypothetical protein